MSRIGKLPIEIPSGVKVEITKDALVVEGPKGKLFQSYLPFVTFHKEGAVIKVLQSNKTKESKSFHGLYQRLLSNMITGVSKGFEKVLLINGVGYRTELKDKTLLLNLGFSNQIHYIIPDDIKIEVENQTRIILRGIDKARVGQAASDIRSIRPPEPYKGMGVRYENEHVVRKEGKTGIK